MPAAAISPADEEILRELVSRTSRKPLRLRKLLHSRQFALVHDRSRNVTACAGRRSGKTFAAVIAGVLAALSITDVNVLYVAASRPNAKSLAWRPLKALLRDFFAHEVAGINESELSVTFKNGSCFQLAGVSNEKEADKVRGRRRLRLVIVDECQSWQDDLLAYFLREVVRPGMLDMGDAAQLWLMGTAKPVCRGIWWERCHSDEYSHHHFDYHDNTKLPDAERLIDADLKAENQTRESVWFQTEYLAIWVDLVENRVYHVSTKNYYTELPDDLTTFLFAVDVGVRDNDHVSALGWHEDRQPVYLVEEFQANGQTVPQLARVLRSFYAKYDTAPRVVIKCVVDSGGGGLKTLLTLQETFRINCEAAEKPPVAQQVRIVNAYLDSGRLLVPEHSHFAKESRQASWVGGVVGGIIKEKVHGDACPTLRYGVIAAAPFLPEFELPEDEQPVEVVVTEADRVRARIVKESLRTQEDEDLRIYAGIDASDDPWNLRS